MDKLVQTDIDAETRCFVPATRPALTSMQAQIVAQCDALKELLLSKNRKYGNSAANPAMVFSNAGALDQIAVRCDDKLNRIRNMGGLAKVVRGAKHLDEDTIVDLAGYLILAKAVVALEQQEDEPGCR